MSSRQIFLGPKGFTMNNKFKIPDFILQIAQTFFENGFSFYLVGGAVRDMIMKKNPSDYDAATDANPYEVMKMFKKVIPTGIEHGTVTIFYMKNSIEVTTFRTESGYSDSRHPDFIKYASTIEEDLSRRDFTMNAIAINLKDFSLIDPFSGRNDIDKKIIRTVNDSRERFLEDGLRPIRCIRFKSQLNFSLEEKTYSSLFDCEVLKKVASISVERFRDEFLKIMKTEKPSSALKIMEETGILKIFIPELLEGRGSSQKDSRGYHIFDVLDHNYYACDASPKEKPLVRLAALFHDIGKPKARTERFENGALIVNFYNHEIYSEEISRKILQRLKFSNAETEKICNLIKNHMFNYESSWTDATVRRFIIRVGKENLDDLIDLRLSDMGGKYNEPVRMHDNPSVHKIIELKDRINEVLLSSSAFGLKDLKVNGKILMELGIPSGKILGEILKELLNCVLEDQSLNTKEKLSEIALKIYKSKRI